MLTAPGAAAALAVGLQALGAKALENKRGIHRKPYITQGNEGGWDPFWLLAI